MISGLFRNFIPGIFYQTASKNIKYKRNLDDLTMKNEDMNPTPSNPLFGIEKDVVDDRESPVKQWEEMKLVIKGP